MDIISPRRETAGPARQGGRQAGRQAGRSRRRQAGAGSAAGPGSQSGGRAPAGDRQVKVSFRPDRSRDGPADVCGTWQGWLGRRFGCRLVQAAGPAGSRQEQPGSFARIVERDEVQ